MSVQCNQYRGFGYLVSFKEAQDQLVELYGEAGYTALADQYHDSAFSESIVEVHGVSMIEDGMSGKYTFFGKIYEKSQNGEYLSTSAIPEVSERDRIIVEHECNRVFNNRFSYLVPQNYIITHYR